MSEPERASDARAVPVSFGATFVRSEAFKALFREGMALVEETAAYLDGDGRTDSGGLDRQAALAYASESMRLTTRLMQIASWLLVQRAVAEGEITPAQAQREKDRVRLSPQEAGTSPAQMAALPERIRRLIAAALRLHARIMHLDRLLAGATAPAPGSQNAVSVQQSLLRRVFEAP